MKKYIKKYLTKLLYEILKEPEMKIGLSKFIIKHTKSKDLNAWDIMKSPYCYEIKLKVTYFDTEEQIKLTKYIEEKPNKFFGVLKDFNVDAKIIIDVDLYTRYKYKGQELLEMHRFTKYGTKNHPDVINKIKDEMFKWYNNHPEMKL